MGRAVRFFSREPRRVQPTSGHLVGRKNRVEYGQPPSFPRILLFLNLFLKREAYFWSGLFRSSRSVYRGAMMCPGRMVSVMRLIPVIIFGSFLLSSCAAVVPLVWPVAMIEGTSIITTEKAVEDHIFSLYSGKECSAARIGKGETYCREDEPNPSPEVHCYQTLGDISCYNQPNPSYGDRKRVAQPESTFTRTK